HVTSACSFTVLPHSTSTLFSLHDALPIFPASARALVAKRHAEIVVADEPAIGSSRLADPRGVAGRAVGCGARGDRRVRLDGLLRSEEHTSELQSRENLVCRLLLEKKKPEH